MGTRFLLGAGLLAGGAQACGTSHDASLTILGNVRPDARCEYSSSTEAAMYDEGYLDIAFGRPYIARLLVENAGSDPVEVDGGWRNVWREPSHREIIENRGTPARKNILVRRVTIPAGGRRIVEVDLLGDAFTVFKRQFEDQIAAGRLPDDEEASVLIVLEGEADGAYIDRSRGVRSGWSWASEGSSSSTPRRTAPRSRTRTAAVLQGPRLSEPRGARGLRRRRRQQRQRSRGLRRPVVSVRLPLLSLEARGASVRVRRRRGQRLRRPHGLRRPGLRRRLLTSLQPWPSPQPQPCRSRAAEVACPRSSRDEPVRRRPAVAPLGVGIDGTGEGILGSIEGQTRWEEAPCTRRASSC